MTNPDFTPASPTEATETLVREQFDSAVTGLQLDVPSLVTGGTVAGRRLQRRRRFQQVGAGIATVAVIAAAGVLGVQGGLFDRNADSPADRGDLTELVPATPSGLAAAVIANLPGVPKVAGAGGIAARVVEADLRLTYDARPVTLAVAAALPSQLPTSCKSFAGAVTGCQSRTLADGTRVVSGDLRPDRSSGVTGRLLILVGPVKGMLLLETQHGVAAGVALPLSDAELVRIAQDPLVGLQTSRAMVEAGEKLPNFRRSALLIGVASVGEDSHGGTSGTAVPPPIQPHTSATQHGG